MGEQKEGKNALKATRVLRWRLTRDEKLEVLHNSPEKNEKLGSAKTDWKRKTLSKWSNGQINKIQSEETRGNGQHLKAHQSCYSKG